MPDSTKFSAIIECIEKNYDENLLLNDIALKFNLSVPYLSKLFKKSTGMNFADFYDNLRINHSMHDILETNIPIIDIAFKYGFPNNHAYIRAFKKVKGQLPSEARKAKAPSTATPGIDEKQLALLNTLLDKYKTMTKSETRKLSISYNAQPTEKLSTLPVSEMLGVGHAVSVLQSATKQLIKKIQSSLFPFRYAYIRGIFSDQLKFCSRASDNKLSFNFLLIDEIFDFLLDQKLLPAVSLTYMPKDLAGENIDTVYSDGYYICGPESLEEWRKCVSTFVEHLVERYGHENVSGWMFIPWTQLDSRNRHLGFNSDVSFFNFYKTSYDAIKAVSPAFTVSSPEIYPSDDEEWIERYFTWTKQHDCRPDNVAIKFFPNSRWKVNDVTDKNKKSYRKVYDEEISPNENLMKQAILRLKSFLLKNGYPSDIYVTAFNYTITDEHPLLDTLFIADYYIKNYTDNVDKIKCLCYWKLRDDSEETSIAQAFSGKCGSYLSNGIAKASAAAIRMLMHTNKAIFDKGDYYMISATGEYPKRFHLITYNYEHPADVNPEELRNNPYSAFKQGKIKHIRFTMTDIPKDEITIRAYTLNKQYGSTYDKWIAMGKPDFDLYKDKNTAMLNFLEFSTVPDFKTYKLPVENGTVTLDFTLELLEIKAFELILEE